MKKLFCAFQKYRAPISAFLLSGLIALSAVWVRQAYVARRAPARAAENARFPAPLQDDAEARAVMPPDGEVLTAFSPRLPVWNETLLLFETHEGIDFSCPDGKVRACLDGRVRSISFDERYGLTIEIDHGNGISTRYASLREALVSSGRSVYAGDVIGTAGTSARAESALGAHVHFAYLENGENLPVPFALRGDS